MSSDWPMVRLGNHCEKIGSGATPKGGKSVYLGVGETALIRSQNVYNEGFTASGLAFISEEAADKLRNVSIESNDILLNITGDSVARVCMAPEEYLPARVNQHVAIIRPDNSRLDSRFVRYFLSSPEQQRLLLTIASSGATRNALTKSHIEKLEVPMPGLEIQQAIANQLETLDKKIKLNHQINQTLEQMAQAIFKSWFVDFEPAKAKMAALEAGGSEEAALIAAMQAISSKDQGQLARFKTEQPEQYNELRTTAELFPSAMQDSELGEIPEGWLVKSLSHFGQIICGKTPSKKRKEYYGAEIPFIKIPDMHSGVFTVQYTEYLSLQGADSQMKKMLPAGAVCVSCIATVGKVLITHRDSQTNQQINSILPSRSELKEYLYFQMLLKNNLLHDLASGGSATLNLNTGNFSKIEILRPSDQIINRFHSVVFPIFEEILNRCFENNSIINVRDVLLPKLLSGELKTSQEEKRSEGC